jgi:lysophospholipase L1-like esterase
MAISAWSTAYLAALSSPENPPPFLPPSRRFAGETVRQKVRLRRGGTAVRLQLSNEFGASPLSIDAITIAVAAAGPFLPVSRDGAARWEVPAGATATSDPVLLSVAAGDELVISCFLAGSTAPATYLHSAQSSGQVAPGDQTNADELPGADRFASLYWISRVLVDTPAAGAVVLAFGDSVTRGDATTVDADQRYPDHLQRRLQAAGAEDAVVLNAGLGADGLVAGPIGPPMVDRLDRDVLSVDEATHVLIMGGLNDVGLRAPYRGRPLVAGDLVEALFGLAERARRGGVRPILGTLTPCAGAQFEMFRADGVAEMRADVNKAIAAQLDWPYVDFAAALADPRDPARLAARYDSGDGVHPNDLGHQAMAAAVDLASLTV